MNNQRSSSDGSQGHRAWRAATITAALTLLLSFVSGLTADAQDLGRVAFCAQYTTGAAVQNQPVTLIGGPEERTGDTGSGCTSFYRVVANYEYSVSIYWTVGDCFASDQHAFKGVSQSGALYPGDVLDLGIVVVNDVIACEAPRIYYYP
ncbi:hypothetical protein JWS13_38970 [Rhodococcus pseudokoreensis]|uniref:Ig-like domain-containing protein n=1 Tax=Rhodococcus pseudokoreensis TaxID=2811421 RepID=A0A974ZXI6_9NOCA|nr:hypothetical protein [Rhodococcus pseudokoreensis]QSE94161.1 hypothetical protein JWS13_38970 [Rhodococcus pseudokoreensis]